MSGKPKPVSWARPLVTNDDDNSGVGPVEKRVENPRKILEKSAICYKKTKKNWKILENPRKILERKPRQRKIPLNFKAEKKSGGKYWKILENIGKYWNIWEHMGTYRKISVNIGKYRKMPENSGKFWKNRLPVIKKYEKKLESIRKYRKKKSGGAESSRPLDGRPTNRSTNDPELLKIAQGACAMVNTPHRKWDEERDKAPLTSTTNERIHPISREWAGCVLWMTGERAG